MAPPPTDSLIAALLAAILGVIAPAAGFVVTVLKPPSATTCSPAAWEAQAQQLADQLAGSGSADAQSLRQQLASAGATPTARDLVAPTTTAGAGSADWQELAATLSSELAASGDPEAQKLAQAIGDTGTPPTRTRTTTAPATSAPGAARPMPGDTGDGSADTAEPTADPGPATPGGGPCPAPSTRSPSTPGPSAGVRPSTQPTSSGRNGDRPWEQLAGQLAAALVGSRDPRAVELQQALDRAGFPSARRSTTAKPAGPRTPSAPVPDDPGSGG